MSYESLLTQKAVYWPKGQPDGYGGYLAEEPRQILCRWQSRQERTTDPEGVEFISRASVYTSVELENDGWLLRGAIDDLEFQTEPNREGAWKVRVAERSQSPANDIVVFKNTL